MRLDVGFLLVERISPSGKVQRWRFQPYWLKVQIDWPVKHDSQLVLSSHGKRLKIGSFLSPDELVEVANALQGALAKLHRPEHLRQKVYKNLRQLRENATLLFGTAPNAETSAFASDLNPFSGRPC